MSWFSKLHTIVADIEKGFVIAAPILGAFVPAVGPVLAEVGVLVGALEQASKQNPNLPVPTPAKVSQLVTAVAVRSATHQAIVNSTKQVITLPPVATAPPVIVKK